MNVEHGPIEVFDLYRHQQVEKLDQLSRTLSEGLEIVGDTGRVNRLLVEQGRNDLVITNPAHIQPFNSVSDFPSERTNNFTPNFQLYSDGAFDNGRLDRSKAHSLIDKEKLRRLRAGDSFEEVFGQLYGLRAMCVGKPAFLRMLVLFPDFTEEFVLSFSEPPRKTWADFRAELFVAYQFMSRLVDENDRGAIYDGKVDESYLTG